MRLDEKRLEIAKLFLDEWKHRDKIYNRHTFMYFSAILLISILPYISFGDFDATNLLLGIDPIIIHIVAIVLSLIAWYVSESLGYRLKLVSDKYREVVKSIKNDFSHNKPYAFFKISIVHFLSASLFLLLIALNTYFIFHK